MGDRRFKAPKHVQCKRNSVNNSLAGYQWAPLGLMKFWEELSRKKNSLFLRLDHSSSNAWQIAATGLSWWNAKIEYGRPKAGLEITNFEKINFTNTETLSHILVCILQRRSLSIPLNNSSNRCAG